MTAIDKFAQMILDDMEIQADSIYVLNEIIGKDYKSIKLTSWPDRAKKNGYLLDKEVWLLEISTAMFLCLRSLFKQYKKKHT